MMEKEKREKLSRKQTENKTKEENKKQGQKARLKTKFFV